jgi:hypothetical protein
MIDLKAGDSIPLGEGFTLKFLGIRGESAEFALLRLYDPAALPMRTHQAQADKNAAIRKALKLFPKHTRRF